MRRGGPLERAASALGLVAARTEDEEEEEDQLAWAFRESLRLSDEPLAPPAASGEAAAGEWILVESPQLGGDAEPPPAAESIAEHNLARATRAGQFALQKLMGEIQRVPRTPAPRAG